LGAAASRHHLHWRGIDGKLQQHLKRLAVNFKRSNVGLKLKSSQWIVDDKNRIVMAEGRMDLLEAIVRTGSINQAAKTMRMSYKSAWSKVRSTETHLKTKIVHSDKSQGTRLTSAGEALLSRYRQMKQRCIAADDAIFDSIFGADAACPDPATPSIPGRVAPPIISFVGHSGSGKTTFVEKLIPLLVQAGMKVAVIKHDVHGFEMDKPGKDTWRHKKAGAAATMISSPGRIGLVMDADHDHQPHELAFMFGFADLILTEGFKRESYPKLEVFRPEATGDRVPLCRDDPQLLAIVSDSDPECKAPVFSLDDVRGVADFLIRYLRFPVE
jgi:molybdopterin-guanine dinucleotide biosynthesis protein B